MSIGDWTIFALYTVAVYILGRRHGEAFERENPRDE